MSRRRLAGTITVRLPASLLDRLRREARESGQTTSEIVRSLVERDLSDAATEAGPSAYELSKRWIGKIDGSRLPAGRDARDVLRGWTSDRRG